MGHRTVLDALPLEYKLQEASARRHGNGGDLVHDAALERECRVLGLGLQEEAVDLGALQRGLVSDYAADLALVGFDSVEPLAE